MATAGRRPHHRLFRPAQARQLEPGRLLFVRLAALNPGTAGRVPARMQGRTRGRCLVRTFTGAWARVRLADLLAVGR